MRTSATTIAAVAVFAGLTLAGCGDDDIEDDDPAGVPNPASVFCEEQGGTVDIETDEDGGQRGICVLPDGTRVDEWEHYRDNQ